MNYAEALGFRLKPCENIICGKDWYMYFVNYFFTQGCLPLKNFPSFYINFLAINFRHIT